MEIDNDNPYGLPHVLDVADIQSFLGIGRAQAYELVNSGQFHCVRFKRRIKVPLTEFLTWFIGRKL
jgi:hypothetical protein